MDHISGLHDALLHNILLRLRSPPAAARTSVPSRRWRHVWIHLPELVLHGRHAPAPTTSFLDSIDAALAAHSAPAVLNLEIEVPYRCCCLCRSSRVAPWLRFASQRLVGKFFLGVPGCTHLPSQPEVWPEELLLELAPCERVTSMELSLPESFLLRFRPAGSFAALTDLGIHSVSMEVRDLEALVSSQCPRLTTLVLFDVSLVTVSDVSIRSPSLQRLWFFVKNEQSPRLEVANP
uniref:Uncharacterized protein n=2 Tax=Avena sativa TaxID=4498 RepID=A0ACD5UKU8_AVESA